MLMQWFHKRKSMISLSLSIALLLSIFVSGINFVSANSASMDHTSVISSTYGLMQPMSESPIVRVVEDFGEGNVHASFVRASGNLDIASRPEPVLYGTHSAKLNYNFVGHETGTAAAYLEFTDPGTADFRTLEGKPTKIGAWIYGDGNNKHWLRAHFNTTNDVADLTGNNQFNWEGWKYVTFNVPSRLTEPTFTDPIKLRRIYVTQLSDTNKTNGTIYFDRVSAFYGDTGGLYGLDLLGLTPMKVGAAQTAQVFETREGYTAPKKVAEPVAFTSSNESVAIVNQQGAVTALSEGETTITASYGVFDATYELVVSEDEPIVEQLYFTGVNELKVFETAQSELFAYFKDVSDPIRILAGATYTSDNEQIATIDESGFITAKAIGKTNLRAAYGNQSAAYELGVEIPIPILQSIKLTGLTPIEIGELKQAKVTAVYNIEPVEVELHEGVTFTSSNPSVATIDNDGLIQGISVGISLITAKFEGKNAVYTIVVNKPNLQPPKRELRAAWISTVENIDWPKTKDPQQQRQDFSDLLDLHQSIGMNAVVMQVKPTADAFYESELAPWSHWITGVQGQYPGYDPLAYMIEEAHDRNLEFHAWFNPYRISMTTDRSKLVEDHPARLHPEWVIEFGGRLYFDPGVPEVIQYITDSVMEVVKNYDVDGVHFDDYFYPNRFDGPGYPDQATYEQYGSDFPGDINAWRRHNVDTLIQKLSEEIKAEKSYVKFGISPFGVWRNKSVDPNGSNTNAGQPSYDNLHADIRKWVIEGWIDYVVPQIYWNFGFSPAAYEILVDWWSDLIEENDANTHLYIGHADYKVGSDANFVDPYEIPNQLIFNLNYEQVKGSVHFTTRDLIAKPELRQMIADVYRYPSLVPTMPWLETTAPEKPSSIQAAAHPKSIEVKWTDRGDSTAYYVVYRSIGEQALNTEDPAQIASILRKSSDQMSFVDEQVVTGETYTYVVTAVDRLHNESERSDHVTGSVSGGGSVGGGGGAIITQPTSTMTLKAGSSGTAKLGEDISVFIPEGAHDEDLQLMIQKLIYSLNLPMPEDELISAIFEITKNVKADFKRSVTITISFDPSKVGENQKPSLFYFDEDQREWIEIGGTATGGKLTAEVDHFTKFAVFAVEKPLPEASSCVNVQLTDIQGHWAKDQIIESTQQCLANGYPDHTFHPDQSVSREEFTVMLVRALQLEGEAETLAFTDLDQIGQWSQSAVSLAVKTGIVNGYGDGSFRPKTQISRAEMAAMIVRALSLEEQLGSKTSFADESDIPVWAQEYVAAAAQAGIIRGRDGNQFAPNEQATRAEAVVMLLRMLDVGGVGH